MIISLILVPLASCNENIDKPLIPDCLPNPFATIADSLQYPHEIANDHLNLDNLK